MIKIEITKDVTDAVKEHWQWVRKRFHLDEEYSLLTDRDQKSAWTRARNNLKELYRLLDFNSLNPKENEQKLHDLICVPPDKLRELRDDKIFKSLVKIETPEYQAYQDWKRKRKRSKRIPRQYQKEYNAEKNRKRVYSLLGYDDLSSKDGDWNAYKICDKIKLSVCPYCNRQYVFTIFDNNRNGEVRPQLDHFYVKSKYPFLSCSFYNLIPSCPTCNLGKNDNGDDTIYPYIHEFGENVVFKFDSNDIRDLNNGIIDLKKNYKISKEFEFSDEDKRSGKIKKYGNLEIKKFKKFVQNSDVTFHIIDLYNEHQLEIKDLIKRKKDYAGANAGIFSNALYKKDLKDLNENERKNLQRFLYGLPVVFDNVEYPLRKLKEDLVDQIENG